MPPSLSGFVINEFFTLGHSELQAVLSRYGVDMRLGAARSLPASANRARRTGSGPIRGGGRLTSCSRRNLRLISPMGFEHINFNGVIVFPFDNYRAQLLASQWGVRGRSRSVVQPILPVNPRH
jgi:hypothetical protein